MIGFWVTLIMTTSAYLKRYVYSIIISIHQVDFSIVISFPQRGTNPTVGDNLRRLTELAIHNIANLFHQQMNIMHFHILLHTC